MDAIYIKPELIEARYWVAATSKRYELKFPTASQSGMNGFSLTTIESVNLKLITRTSKTIPILDKKTDTIESHHYVLTLAEGTMSFITSDLFASFDEDIKANATKYMQRVVGALHTIEAATLTASQTASGEGADTSAFTAEESAGRERLHKATKRLNNLFVEFIDAQPQESFEPVYLMANVDVAISNYIDDISVY